MAAEFILDPIYLDDGETFSHTFEASLTGVSKVNYDRVLEFFVYGLLVPNYRFFIPANETPKRAYTAYIDNICPVADSDEDREWEITCALFKTDSKTGDPDYDKEVFSDTYYVTVMGDGDYRGGGIDAVYYPNTATSRGISSIYPFDSLKYLYGTDAVLYARINPGYMFDGWYDEDGDFADIRNPRHLARKRIHSTYQAKAKSAQVKILEVESDGFTVACSKNFSASYSDIENELEDIAFYINIYNTTTDEFICHEYEISYDQFFDGFSVHGLPAGKYAVNLGMMTVTHPDGDAHTNIIQWIAKAGSDYEPPIVTIAKKQYTLTIEHRRETIAGGSYELYAVYTETIDEGTIITLADYQESYNGFEYYTAAWAGAHVEQITINSDATITLFYSRLHYDITFKGENVDYFIITSDYREDINCEPGTSLGFTYDEELTVTPYGEDGYEWESWSTDIGEILQQSRVFIFNVPASDLVLTANMTKTVIPLTKWEWSKDETYAFENEGQTDVLTCERWNAFLDWCNTVIEYYNGDKTISNACYLSSGNKSVLTAAIFNEVVDCIEGVSNLLPDNVSSTKSRGDIVFGEYFPALSGALNGLF